jgi:ABC-type transporter Mla MlaB component
MVIPGPLAHGDAPALCARLRTILDATDAPAIGCDVAAVRADGVTVDALARLQLTARRADRAIVLRRPSRDLVELVYLCGLAAILPLASGVEARGQPEEREEAIGVEEAVDRGDAIA